MKVEEIAKEIGVGGLKGGITGASVGAALYVYHHVLGNSKAPPTHQPYLGKENTDEEIISFVKSHNIKAKKLSHKQLVEQVVNLIAKKKVVGWVRGRFEWGPRALGARSIIADPGSKKMKDIVNAKIKFSLFKEVLGTSARKQVEQIKIPELLMINVNSSISVGNVTKIRGDEFEMNLRIPIVPFKGENVSISRMVDGHWRLIGWGEIV